MIHPEDLLAGAVDGALTDRERAELEAHLAGCERCREELELGAHARRELGALPEVPAPASLASAVLEEATRPAPAPGAVPDTRAASWPPPRPRRKRPVAGWVAGLAAAAAIVGFLAIVVLPGGSSNPITGAGGVKEAVAPAGQTAPLKGFDYLLVQPKANFTAAEVQGLAHDIATGKRTVLADLGSAHPPSYGPTPPGPTPSANAAGVPAATPPTSSERQPYSAGLVPATPGVAACIRQGAQIKPTDRVAQVLQAKFNATPAYIVALREEAGSAPAKVIVWVVAKDGCRLLSYTQATR